ncbi:hypothetical protein SAY87_029023 [Trapa incisa]|uniref:Uncharacterized protein n=1 Tax=Trapa incisa TaxID=236973 RepID=A0AAN7QPB3_9MYRT|nr:hypothetical protein SAY87_029023 [Trapa incisa]
MEGSSKLGGGSDLFFDSAEYISSSEEEVDYGIWVNEPKSVKERRENFLSRMDFGEFGASSYPDGQRLCKSNGAVSSSWDMSSIDECLVTSMGESGNDANDLIDELDDDPENESPSPKYRQREKPEESQSGSGRKVSRWWSFMAKGKRNIAADQLDHKDTNKSPLLSKLKVQHNQKRSKELTGLYSRQEIQAHSGIIWTMKFSPDGQFLASGGSDGIVRVWRVSSANAGFSDLSTFHGGKVKSDKFHSRKKGSCDSSILIPDRVFCIEESPVQEFHGHKGDILDLAWSNSNLLLSSSADKTVRLWSLNSKNSLHIFHHVNYVTCIQFNPVHENYFISGSLDGKVRVWGVSEKRVVDWADVRDVITAICYQPNGNGFVVGSIVGTCHFFVASGVHLHLDRIIVLRGPKKTLNKVVSIQFSQENPQRVLITSEDGIIQVFEGSDIVRKYKGPKSGSQLSASFSSSEKHIVSVGDDSQVYLWNYDSSSSSSSSSVLPSKNKAVKSVQSCEYFHSEGVSIALPWSRTDRSLLRINIRNRLQCCSTKQGCPPELGDSNRFYNGSWFSLEGSCLGAATWPEEKLLLWESWDCEGNELQSNDSRATEEMVNDAIQVSETWGLVLVTASLDGKIRTFHNYGLPMRL